MRLRTLCAAVAIVIAGCGRRHHGDPPLAPPSAYPLAAPSTSPALEPAVAAVAANEGPFFVADPSTKVVAIRRADAPNIHYAALDREACEGELLRRGVPFVRGEATDGVLAPVRLRGPVRGVIIHSALPPKERERSIYEIFDCRLVLALDDFAGLIAQRDVVEMIHLNAYRPKTQHGCTARYWGLQHCAALAVDVRAFKRKDGTILEVERDFHGRIGLGTCASGVGPAPETPASTLLWWFVCDAARRALFHVMLTPNYNVEHRNHFHLEITPEAGWMMIK